MQVKPAIYRRPQVEALTGLARSTLYQRIKEGKFPAPLALGAKSVGWDAEQVEAWIADRLANGAAELQARKAA